LHENNRSQGGRAVGGNDVGHPGKCCTQQKKKNSSSRGEKVMFKENKRGIRRGSLVPLKKKEDAQRKATQVKAINRLENWAAKGGQDAKGDSWN